MRNILLLALAILPFLQVNAQKRLLFKENYSDTLCGVINMEGEVIIENNYKKYILRQNYIWAFASGGLGDLYTSEGKEMMTGIGNFQANTGNDFIMYERNIDGESRWALYSIEGKQITDFDYSVEYYTASLINDYFDVKKDGKFMLIDSTGSAVFSNTDMEAYRKQLKAFESEYYKKHFADELIVEEVYAESSSNSNFIFKQEETGKFGIRKNGSVILPAEYQSIRDYCCGCFILAKDGKHGVFHINGKMLLDTEYDKIEAITKNAIIAVKNGAYSVYSTKTGEKAFDKEYGYIGLVY